MDNGMVGDSEVTDEPRSRNPPLRTASLVVLAAKRAKTLSTLYEDKCGAVREGMPDEATFDEGAESSVTPLMRTLHLQKVELLKLSEISLLNHSFKAQLWLHFKIKVMFAQATLS
jgi:hypothetical protein